MSDRKLVGIEKPVTYKGNWHCNHTKTGKACRLSLTDLSNTTINVNKAKKKKPTRIVPGQAIYPSYFLNTIVAL